MMPRRIVLGGLLLVLSIAPLAGQAKWVDPYKRGVQAVRNGRWEEAIKSLEQAVRIDPNQGANKYTEGSFPEDYFPYLYLGIAHLKLGHLEQAQTNFRKTTERRMPSKYVAELKPYEAELAVLLRPAPNPAPPPVESKPAPAAPAGVDPKFLQELAQADAALAAGRYAEAIAQFDALSKLDPAEFAKRGLSVKRDDAAERRANELALEGQRLLAELKLSGAQAAFQQAERLASSPAAVAGLRDIRRRRADYQSFRSGAADDVRAGRLADATGKLQRAREADPEQFRADNLAAEARQIEQKLAAMSGAGSGSSKVAAVPETLRDQQIAPIRDALAAYLQGNARQAAALLEPITARSDGLDRRVRAHAHAYLAVAYADLALIARADRDRDALRGQALDQFRLATTAEAGYQLSQLISPRIRELLEPARAKR